MATKESQVQGAFQWTNASNQYYATFIANLIMFGHGTIVGWMAPALLKLTSESTPLLSDPLTNEQVSWIGSVNCIGGLIGSILFGYITTLIGCKRTLLYVTIPAVISWVLIYFGSCYSYIFLARFTSGLAGGGIQTLSFLYITEIANDDLRGRLGSVTLFMRNIGILIAYILGATIDYELIPCICIVIPIIYVILFFMLPNTPRYLLQIGKIQAAEDALKYYLGFEGKCDREYNALYKEFERLKSIACERKAEERLCAADFYNRTALKGLGIGFAMSVLSQFSANFVIITYAVTIFDRIGTSVDPYLSSILLAVTLIFGSLLTTYLADKLGRRILNLISFMGSALGLMAISLYYYLHINGFDLSVYEWVPVTSLSFVIFISSAGVIPLTIICSIECIPAKIRAHASTMISVIISIAAFVMVKLFPILLEIVDLHGCMIILGIGCFVGFFFVLIFMEETSGQSLDDIGVDEKMKMEKNRARINSI